MRKAVHEDANVTFVEEEEAEPSVTRPIELLRSMVLNGLPRDSASLTLVDGIGSKWAKRLVDAGIASIEALAFASKSRLQNLNGLSEERAAKWITDAKQLHDTSEPPD